MPLFGRGEEELGQDVGTDTVSVAGGEVGHWQEVPGTIWADELERFRTMSVPERAAEVMATVGPALAERFDEAPWKQGIGPKHTEGHLLLALLIPGPKRPDKLTPEQWRAMYELRVTLAEALNALANARLLINWDSSGAVGAIHYAVSPDGLAALERGEVAEVVARRLPD